MSIGGWGQRKAQRTTPVEDGMIITEGGPIGYDENLIGKLNDHICFPINLKGSLILPSGCLHTLVFALSVLRKRLCVCVCVCVCESKTERDGSPATMLSLPNMGKIVIKFLKMDCKLPCCLN